MQPSSAAPHPQYPFPVYGYTNGGEMDTGWGCVYRSVQNVQASCGLRVWSIGELVHYAGREWGHWAEPADFKALFRTVPGRVRARALLVGGPSKQWLKFTRREDYDLELPFSEFKWKPRASYVVDNGVSGYAVVSISSGRWFIDPHTSTPAAVPLTTQLRGKKGWMILEVEHI